MEKSDFLLRLTKIVLDTLFKLTNAELRIHGEEKIPDQHVLYVINHFTRMETFFLPYLIRNITGKDVLSLAFSGLFGGGFGNLLQKLGAVSTDSPERGRVIGSALLKGDVSCLIFPEGQMVKDKKIIERGKFMVYNSGIRRPPHTGAAIYALMAEFYREKLKFFIEKGNTEGIRAYREYFYIDNDDMLEKVVKQESCIIPVNITYFPIRARRNVLNKIAERFVDTVPERLQEELEVEGAMVVDGVDIDVNFGDPIYARPYLKKSKYLKKINNSELYLKNEDVKENLSFIKDGIRLMYSYMHAIYNMTTVNCEHIFAYILEMYRSDKINEFDYKNRVFMALENIKNIPLRYNHSLLKLRDEVLLTEAEDRRYNDFIEAIKAENLIKEEDGYLVKNSEKFSRIYEFHTIRRDNIVEVLKNEITPLRKLVNALNLQMMLPEYFIRKKMRSRFLKLDRELFKSDYDKYFIESESKPPEIGRPFFLKRALSNRGVLLIHGYMAAPEEMRELADFLYNEGYNVYGVRLRGHGTAPEDLAIRKWEEWMESVNRGYLVLRNSVDNVAVVGFSTGAGLAMLESVKRKGDIKCAVSINAPLHLSNIASRFASVVTFWNNFLGKIHVSKGRMEFITNQPQNPHINYFRNPVFGVYELEKLMRHTESKLKDVNLPILVIQGDNDPVVNPASGPELFEKIGSEKKEYSSISTDRHVIVRGEYSEAVFEEISRFLKKNF